MENPLLSLFELGLSPTLYDQDFAFWELDASGHLHGQPSCMNQAEPDGPAHKQARNLTDELELCHCWMKVLSGKTLDTYLDAVRLQMDEEHYLGEASSKKQPEQSISALTWFHELRWFRDSLQRATHSPDALTTWRQRLLQQLDDMFASTQTYCRSEATRKELTEHWASEQWWEGDDDRVLVLLAGFSLEDHQSRLATALCSWTIAEKERMTLLVTPAWFVQVLVKNGMPVQEDALLHESDTPAVLETVVALWSGDKNDTFYNVASALTAARSL